MKIPFNKPYFTDKESQYIQHAAKLGKLSGNGYYTKKCQSFFEEKYGFKKCFLTTSCTSALEMSAILLNVGPGDEVIIPSYTFVSTANAFVLRGATIKFADSLKNAPHLDPNSVASLITAKTKAIVVMHYAGIACDMDAIEKIADKNAIHIIEDAAQAINAYYNGQPLGGIGAMSAFSFHETKNIGTGEGGMLVINDEKFIERAEIIWEKGTNRASFFRGEANKYEWIDLGSSFLPSEITAAVLYAQLEELDRIQERRISIWNKYFESLKSLASKGHLFLPEIPDHSTNNGHLFYLLFSESSKRDYFIEYMRSNGIHAVFHYLSLHKSPFHSKKYDGKDLPYSDFYENNLVRLPLFYDLKNEEQDYIIDKIKDYFL